MPLIMNQGLPDGHPWKNGTISFVKRPTVTFVNGLPQLQKVEPKVEAPKEISSENQSPKLAPEGPETESESIRAEALRRLKVDRFVERTPAPTSNLSESQSNTQQTMESVGVCGP